MKHLMKMILILLGTGSLGYGQNCLQLKEGQTLTNTTSSWVNTLIADKKFQKANEEGRAKLVESFNQDLLSGKVKGFGGVPCDFVVKNARQEGNQESVDLTLGPFAFPIECRNDTLWLWRNKGIKDIKVNDATPATHPSGWSAYDAYTPSEKTIGMLTQGASVIPNNLKVGDQLPVYEDIIVSFPASWTQEIKRKVADGYRTVTSTERGWVSGVDSRDGQYYAGLGTKTTTSLERTFKTISANVNVEVSASTYIMHHVFATVTRSEELKMGKKTYTTWVIESENWSKNTEITDYKSENEQLNALLGAEEARYRQMVDKKFRKMGLTTDKGYVIEYVTEWFVPGIGIVKMETVDMHGVITARSETTQIK
ncbi:MAG: hypothetical protein H6581_25450 [Bacteroidia bacterium]|nr:hypothetical protein [Bacteroidia bacterium]